MNSFFSKTFLIYHFGLLSIIGHLLCGYLLREFAHLDFGMPVSSPIQEVVFTLNGEDIYLPLESGKEISSIHAHHNRSAIPVALAGETGHDSIGTEYDQTDTQSPAMRNNVVPESSPGNSFLNSEPAKSAGPEVDHGDIAPKEMDTEGTVTVSSPFSADYDHDTGPVRSAGEFVATKRERLTYRISLLMVPVGSAVMEADNNGGELRITVRITSNAVLSAIYPVDDLVETHMVKGNYLLTRVRQKEGDYRGDFGFTLMLREHKAFWVDRLANRYSYQPIPVDDVLDVVSGFYFLRKMELEVGRDILLHLFDSNEYSPTTVEVLRRERIALSGSRELDTLVLHPIFTTAGFFRRTGDILIWLSDDKFKVPVRMETFITLGRVTAELVSAESDQE